MEKNSYVCCVSVNEIENGVNVGRMMGHYSGKQALTPLPIHGIVLLFLYHTWSGLLWYACQR